MESVKELLEKLTGTVESEVAKERDALRYELETLKRDTGHIAATDASGLNVIRYHESGPVTLAECHVRDLRNFVDDAEPRINRLQSKLYEWERRALTAERELLEARKEPAEGRFTIAWLQKHLPWTVPYTEAFTESQAKEGHRNFAHDIMHVMKSLGRLAALAERFDHSHEATIKAYNMTGINSFKNDVASLVICALHIASNNPIKTFDLEATVIDHLESRNKVKLDPAASVQAPICGSRAQAPNHMATCVLPEGHVGAHEANVPHMIIPFRWARSRCSAPKVWLPGEVIHCILGEGHRGDHQHFDPKDMRTDRVRQWPNV